MENKNTIIAIVLMLLVWVGFTFFFPHKQPIVADVPAVISAKTENTTPRVENIVDQGLGEISTLPVAQIPVREIKVENDLYIAVFSTSGGRLQSLQLKNYRKEAVKDSPFQAVVEARSPKEASLRTTGTDGLAIGADARYLVDYEGEKLALSGADSEKLVFRLPLESGLVVEKIFSFTGDGYAVDLDIRVSNISNSTVSGNFNLGLVQPWDDSMADETQSFVGPSLLVGDKVQRIAVKDIKSGSKIFGKDTLWGGFQTAYFFSGVIPVEGSSEKTQISFENNSVNTQFETPYVNLLPGQVSDFKFTIYNGPNDFDILQGIGNQLERIIDFGFFAILAKPLFHILKFFHSFVNNFGVSIVLLTVIIKLAFWPLTQKSYASMKSMQKLQPEMAKIKEKYKNDRDRMNREMMEFYKNNKVNPLGGCLPMVVQIPVFFALYQVLLHSIDLRHAHFFLWLTDLSAKDPYYITPIIMGGTMFLQQKMTPTNVDPMQAKIFMAMPLIFTVMFLNFPCGLVIYWLTNNILTILQQYLINRK